MNNDDFDKAIKDVKVTKYLNDFVHNHLKSGHQGIVPKSKFQDVINLELSKFGSGSLCSSIHKVRYSRCTWLTKDGFNLIELIGQTGHLKGLTLERLKIRTLRG